MEPSRKRREEDLRLAGEDRSPKKWVEAGMNYGSWRLIEVERTHRQPKFLKEQRTLLLLLLLLLFLLLLLLCATVAEYSTLVSSLKVFRRNSQNRVCWGCNTCPVAYLFSENQSAKFRTDY